MSPSKAAIAVLLVSTVLSACGSAEPPPPEADEHKALQRAIQEPLDKARAVEGELQKQQKAMQRQMDDAEE
jgi:hypothetical protein